MCHASKGVYNEEHHVLWCWVPGTHALLLSLSVLRELHLSIVPVTLAVQKDIKTFMIDHLRVLVPFSHASVDSYVGGPYAKRVFDLWALGCVVD